ncbi:MAG TPA: ABC transporter permease [Steroidobacteraceae bacterium]|nr:ABC transporter permease [Steroidobacteraceae bacterium]
MIGYYVRLALKSFRRTPGLTALMACAIACGIAACIVTLTVYHTLSGNPIWWKNGVLYAVTMDSWDPKSPYDPAQPGLAPDQLTYQDATYLFDSDIPRHKALLTLIGGALSGAPGQSIPAIAFTDATTAGFFHMFDVPFEYGGPWSAAADRGPDPVIVLSRNENDELFGGADSVGRSILWNDQRFRIVGVLDHWRPEPKFYSLSGGGTGDFGGTTDAFVPFRWDVTQRHWPAGTFGCWGSSPINTYRELLGSECVWVTLWVELPTAGQRRRFLDFMNAYWAHQRANGRFQRPRNNHLWKVSQWLKMHHVVSDDSRLLLRLAFAFLAVCLINTVGILLAKFLRGAPVSGIRRALGASRRQLFEQHLVEVALLSLGGSSLGVALGALGLQGVHAMYAGSEAGYGAAAHFDVQGILWALALAALSTLVAGVYPAWRIGRVSPAAYLKSQ